MSDTQYGSVPQRPDDPIARRNILLEKILPTTRLQKRPWLETLAWLLLLLSYLPLGLVLMLGRYSLLFTYTLLGATLLPRKLSGWLGVNVVFPILGFRIKLNNVHSLHAALDDNTFFVMVLNHVSYVDSPMLARLIGGASPRGFALLASTLMGGKGQWELLKRLGLLRETVYTQSTASTPKEKETTRAELLSLAKQDPNEADVRPLVVFPEGQVHDCTNYLLRYEKFCFGLHAPILPIAVTFHQPWPVNLWIVGDNPLVSLSLLLFVPFVMWEYHIGGLVRAEEGETDGVFATRIQGQMARTLGCQPTEFRLTDVGEVIDYLAKH